MSDQSRPAPRRPGAGVVAERFGPSDEHAAGVIVLGAGNQSVLGGVLGSVVARVVHDTNRPVLVIPAPPEGR